MPIKRPRHHAKNHGAVERPSVVPFKILYSEGAFEVASYEHFGLEQPFDMVAMTDLTPKCPLEGDIVGTQRLFATWHKQGKMARVTTENSFSHSLNQLLGLK